MDCYGCCLDIIADLRGPVTSVNCSAPTLPDGGTRLRGRVGDFRCHGRQAVSEATALAAHTLPATMRRPAWCTLAELPEDGSGVTKDII